MRSVDGNFAISNGGAGATSAAFNLVGGRYLLEIAAAGSGGTAVVQKLGPDGATYNTVPPITAALTAAGSAVYDLPTGSYKIATTVLTAVYAGITRIPQD